MKALLVSLIALGSISSYADEVICSGKSLFKHHHVYFNDVTSSSASLTLREFVRGEHNGEFIKGPAHLYLSYMTDDTETKFHFTDDLTHAPTIEGYIDLESGKGILKTRNPRRNIKLNNCRI